MKIIKIEDGRKLNVSCLVVGYLEENKIEKLQFEIPEEYKGFGRKACFKANDKTFAKSFDNITDNTLTLTRDMTQYDELEMSIAFFKIENEDEIVARTSILKIYIENAIVCDDDIKPDEPKVVILDELIQKVTELNEKVTKDEETRQNQETTRQQNETVRQENETVRETNEQARIKNELARKKAEEERKTNENAREEYINNLKVQVDNGEFDGADFNYKWDDTKLGVKNSKETTYQFVELKGNKGDKGDTGNGIQSIEKVSTVENVDTYAIHYTDGTQTTFDVTNGEVTKEQLDEVDNRAKKTRNELERVKNDILETGTASDSFINVQDSAWAELQELSVDGVLKQTTTTGKNLMPTTDTIDKKGVTFNGVTFKLNDDESITANGTATASLNIYLNKNLISMEPGTYTLSDSVATGESSTTYFLYADIKHLDGTNWDEKNLATYAVNTSTIDEQFLYKSRIVIRNGITLNNVTFYPQLEIGPSATSYEPYTGGQPSPSPDYPQEIKTITANLKLTSCNKNLTLINFSSEIKGGVTFTHNDDGSITLNGTASSSFEFVLANNVKLPSGTYAHSINNIRKGMYVSFDNSADNILNGSAQKKQAIFKLNKEKIYSKYFIWIDKDTIFNNDTFYIQLERNSTATSFEQHLQSQITANLPEGEFIGKLNDTYKDTLKVVYKEDRKHHLILNKIISKTVLNGTQPISYSRVINDDKFVAQFNIGTAIKSSSPMISDKFIYKSNGWTSNSENISTGGSNNNLLQIKILQSRLEEISSNGLTNWLSTHPVEVYYVLNTPYEVDLGIVDMPLSYDEITNIFTDSDLLPQINTKYYRNFTKTVQNLQINEKALKQELIDINNRLTALETAKASESEVNNDIPVE